MFFLSGGFVFFGEFYKCFHCGVNSFWGGVGDRSAWVGEPAHYYEVIGFDVMGLASVEDF